MAQDPREKIYDDLHHAQLARERERNRASARRILGILQEYFAPRSVLDVGCGLGTWLAVARELGAAEIYGVDGSWLDPALLEIDPAFARRCDLEKGIALERKFDLVVCLEVAEHLHERAADTLVASLAAHGDVVLFSAAIPFQGGHHHVNEQFADYWAERFARHGYRALDFVRPRIWTDPEVLWWLRQNALVYAHERALERHPRLRAEAGTGRILSMVLPDVYLSRMKAAQRTAEKHRKLMSALSGGGTFRISVAPDGALRITKTGK